MNIGKRFDRMKQWTDERMGKEIKTAASDEFKALELEMQLRHEGISILICRRYDKDCRIRH